MHLYFERVISTRTDCNVLSLTWMGKVPDELPDDDGWKLNRSSYYQDGWLATGNARGIVGVTFTTCSFRKMGDLPLRTNYNLRGHRSEIILVKWNEPYQKLASCDSSGIIFVWIKYEGRWSIELINDRSTKVTDFSWSHDGRMALICYQDGFVLVGSVAGQRYWSSMLNLEATITCGIWAPDDQQVLFGTSNGQIIVIDVHGTVVAQICVQDKVVISSMSWSCEKFKMEETDDDENSDSVHQQQQAKSECQSSALAICFQNGTIYLMKSYDDVSPVVISTGLKGVKMEWSNNGDVLAVAGFSQTLGNEEFNNYIHFYTDSGCYRFSSILPCTQCAVTALTWGHNDKRLFIATGFTIQIGWVTRRVASLQLLSRLAIHNCLHDESSVQKLPLPRRLRTFLSNMFGQTIKCYLPEPKRLRDFVSKPPVNSIRLHCTMIRHDDDVVTGNATYTLFLEYLGGLLPLLKGKRASKIRPEFFIFDPEVQANGQKFVSAIAQSVSPPSSNCSSARVPLHLLPSSSDSEVEEGCASPRLQRRRRHRRQNAVHELETLSGSQKELVYLDDLPESYKLVAVTSNIWGTKFKLFGLAPWLPALLGTISYRTSLLHLQPRQMTLVMKELNGPESADPNRLQNLASNSLVFSEDEDDVQEMEGKVWEDSAPVAPMTPKKQQKISGSVHFHHPHYFSSEPHEEYSSTTTGNNVKLLPPEVHLSTFHSDLQNGCSLPVTFQTHALPVLFQNKAPLDTPSQMTFVSGEKYSCPSPLPAVMNGVAVHESENLKKTCSARDARNGFICNGAIGYCPDDNYDGKESFQSAIPESSFVKTGSTSETNSVGCGPEISPTKSHVVVAPRWAEKVGDLKYIDEDMEEAAGELHIVGCPQSASPSSMFILGHRSRSIGHLQSTEIGGLRDFKTTGSFKDHQRRLILKSRIQCERDNPDYESHDEYNNCPCATDQSNSAQKNGRNAIENLQSSTVKCDNGVHSSCVADQSAWHPQWQHNKKKSKTHKNDESSFTCPQFSTSMDEGTIVGRIAAKDDSCKDVSSEFQAVSRMKEHRASLPQTDEMLVDKSSLFGSGSKSIPSSPVSKRRDSNSRKGLLYSPRLLRRRRQKMIDSSDEDISLSGEDTASEDFKDLESFQKAYIRKKLKKWRGGIVADGQDVSPASNNYREFVLHNKAPLWNEMSQVYQLDFGGRVTQESAKNFQVEFRSKQVMQFGRIDGNAYTLDFQYPFCALQAFAVALANVTQRLK